MAKTVWSERGRVRRRRERVRVEEGRLTGGQRDEGLLTSRELLYAKSFVALRVERDLEKSKREAKSAMRSAECETRGERRALIETPV